MHGESMARRKFVVYFKIRSSSGNGIKSVG